jgi:heme A synthase
MIDILVYLAIFVIIAILVWWLLSQLSLPEPLRTILIIVIVVIGAVILINILLNFTGHGLPMRY